VKTNVLERDEAVVEVEQRKGIRESDKVDVETDEKDRVEEDAKTQQKAEYVPTTITCYPILKTKIPN
jgi:hypothetical protein